MATGQYSQKQIHTKGDTVYRCDTCSRKVRVPTNRQSFDVVQRCIITKNCTGKLHKVLTRKEANEVSSIPDDVPNVSNWFQRKVFYSHTQSIEKDTWTVNHNLANRPMLQTFVYQLIDNEETLVEVQPESVEAVDSNTIIVHFARAYKEIVQCMATASANTINPAVAEEDATTSLFMLTNDGEITIATEDNTTPIALTLTYRTGTNVDIIYDDIDDQASLLSPWSGASSIYIGGRKYTVRSFNIRTHPNASAIFAAGTISNGSQMSFSGLPSQSQSGKNLILLGQSPFAPVDKITNRYIDIASISSTQPELVYASGEVSCNPSIIKSTYPHIYIVD
jgi:hypothetical protein